MKRIIVFISAISLLFVMSCDKLGNDSPSLNLCNTVWAASGDTDEGDDYRQVLNFYDDSHVAYYPYFKTFGTPISSVPSMNSYEGTYSVISNSEVSFNLVRTHKFGFFTLNYVYEKGVISGNAMTVTQSSNGKKSSYVYYKQ